MKMIAKGMKKL